MESWSRGWAGGVVWLRREYEVLGDDVVKERLDVGCSGEEMDDWKCGWGEGWQ